MSYAIKFKRKPRLPKPTPRRIGLILLAVVVLGIAFWTAVDIYLYIHYEMPHPHSGLVWGAQFGGPGNDIGEAVAVDRDGNVYVAGETDGSLFGASSGHTDVFVAKFSAKGARLWGREFTSDGDETVDGVAADSQDDVYLVGGTEGSLFGKNAGGDPDAPHHDAFVVKLGPHGSTIWSTQFGTSEDDQATGIAVDNRDYVYVCGDTNGSLYAVNGGLGPESDGESSASDVWVAKFAPDGRRVYATQFGAPGDDNASAIAVDRSGEAFVAGQSYGLFRTDNGDRDDFIAKITARGLLAWGEQVTVRQDSFPPGVACDRGGDAYLAADMVYGIGFREAFPTVAKYRGDSALLGRTQIYSNVKLDILAAVPDTNGGLTLAGSVTGYSFGAGNGAPVAYVTHYGPRGAQVWEREVRSSVADLYDCACVEYDGHVYVAGRAEGAVFGPAAGGDDVIAAKYGPNGHGPVAIP